MDREETEDLRKRIICYWDTAGLCSFDSSTSIKDSNIAYLESCIHASSVSRSFLAQSL